MLKPYKKASNTLQKHLNKDPSVLNIPRSNQRAKHSIKVMQELYSMRKKER